MTRKEAIAHIVTRKARRMGAHGYERLAVRHALNAYAEGHTAHRAVRRGVGIAAELADGARDPR